MSELDKEIKDLKKGIQELEKEVGKKKSNKKDKEMEDLEKALKNAIENWKNHKEQIEPKSEVVKEKKKLNWRKGFTVILTISRLVVFASFMYTALVLYNLDKIAEALVVIVAVSLFVIMNKLEGG